LRSVPLHLFLVPPPSYHSLPPPRHLAQAPPNH
jgi:hypothetical protein